MTLAGNANTVSTSTDNTVSYEYTANSAISGYVYCDNDNDGIYTGHSTIPHVTMTLQYQDSTGHWQNWTTNPYQQTNDQGWYGFANLPAGSYRVVETQPAEFTGGGPNTIEVGLAANTRRTDVDFGDWGLKPQYVSRRLMLASTPSTQQLIQSWNQPPVVDLNGPASPETILPPSSTPAAGRRPSRPVRRSRIPTARHSFRLP